jgi:hypothetical protein
VAYGDDEDQYGWSMVVMLGWPRVKKKKNRGLVLEREAE